MSQNDPRGRALQSGRTASTRLADGSRPRDRRAGPDESQRGTDRETVAEVLELLGDEYAREVLAAIVDRPRSATEVAAVTSVSRSTAFRRLDRLEAVGLAEMQPAIDPDDGNHCRRFEAAIEGVTVSLESEGFELAIEPREAIDGEPRDW